MRVTVYHEKSGINTAYKAAFRRDKLEMSRKTGMTVEDQVKIGDKIYLIIDIAEHGKLNAQTITVEEVE